MAGEVAGLGEDAAKFDEGAFEGEDTFEEIGLGIEKDLVFDDVDLFAVGVEDRDVGIDDAVEDAIEYLVVIKGGIVTVLFDEGEEFFAAGFFIGD